MLLVHGILALSLLLSNADSKSNEDIWNRIEKHDVSLQKSLSELRMTIEETTTSKEGMVDEDKDAVQQLRGDVSQLRTRVQRLEKLLESSPDVDNLPNRTNRTDVYEYLGCYKDNWNRAMLHQILSNDMTTKMCLAHCKEKRLALFATQNGQDCWYGGYYDKHGALHKSSCNVRCKGDKNVYCGGLWANSVYKMVE